MSELLAVIKPHINVQDLNVYYGNLQVLKNINLDVPRRQITAIIGSSGCGKTTLLRSMNRLIELVENVRVCCRIYVDGIDIMEPSVDVTEIRRKMPLIAQTPAPLPMSIYDNVAYGPRLHGMKEVKPTVEQCLRSSGLWEEVKNRLKDPASRLSIGQQQRLCLARALAVDPEVLLCDEPTSALDPISTLHVEKQFKILSADYTIVFVTHTLRQARRIADNAIFIHMGEIIEQGPADSIFNHPKNPTTKAYLEGAFS
jgi:phosphate transport system ATP-binding protein